MVGDDGQLYTIEGIAASVLILTTVYLVLSSTILLTPAETHIYDMQLEQLGNDALAVMDAPESWNAPSGIFPPSPLETFVETNDTVNFTQVFLGYCNATVEGKPDDLSFNATIFYRKETDPPEVQSKYFAGTAYNREHAVMVSRWVNIGPPGAYYSDLDNRTQTVLLEVLLWHR
jgi:hypothetical protein